MSRPIASTRAFFKSLQELPAPARQCRRLLSTSQFPPAKRPSVAPSIAACQRHQPFAQKRFKKWKSIDEAKSRYQTGPFSWKAAVLFITTAVGLLYYFEYEKERMQKKRIAEATKGIGKPKVGGSFKLVDQNGNPFTEENLKGRFSLIYFGFTHCPDICPEELDKMASMFDIVDKEIPGGLSGVFITCDPARDGPEELKKYLAEFHPKFVGLTGTWEDIKATCKTYRVYFSTPPQVKPGQDYLVDHSIYFYLMDPEGDFVEALGRQHSPQDGAKLILGHMKNWKGQLKKD